MTDTPHASPELTSFPPPPSRDHYVNTDTLGSILGVSRQHLKQMRVRGDGPPFARLGSAVRYRVGDALDWAAARRASSTTAADALGDSDAAA